MRQQLKLWDSKREREKMNRPEHTAGRSQNKGTEQFQRRASQRWTSSYPARGRRQGGGERGKLGPRDDTPTKLQTGLQFLIKDFLRFWMVDIRGEGCS